MKKQIITVITAAALTISMAMTALAGTLTYQINEGDTGKTTTWTNPITGETMSIPVVTTGAKITLTGDGFQPEINEYNADGTILSYDGIMADFSAYPVQEIETAEIMDRLSSNYTTSPWEGQVPFPDSWVCFVDTSGSAPYQAFYVTANPDSVQDNINQTTN